MTSILNQHEDYQQAQEAYGFPLIIKQLLNRAKIASTDQTISYANKVTYTYAEFFKRVNRLANVLKNMGLQAGDVVAVMDWDSHRYLEAYFAVPMSGMILQTVNVRLAEDKVLYTINHAKPKALLLNAEFEPMAKNYRHEAPSIEKIVWLDDTGFDDAKYAGDDIKNDTKTEQVSMPDYVEGEYEAMLAAASDAFDFPDFDENTIATTFYTSGTTGDPKGVFFTHRQIVLQTLASTLASALNAEGQGARYNDVYMPMTPLFHVHAWCWPYGATMIGLKQVYPGRYLAPTLVDLIEQHKVTLSHGVPAILQMLLKEMAARGRKFEGLKLLLGGSKLNEGLAKAAIESGIEFMSGFGMSESCPVLSRAVFDDKTDSMEMKEQLNYRCLSGSPIMLVSMEIWDENGKALPMDGESTGELVIRAPWLTQSYFKNPDAGNELWRGGWMHTQDIACITSDGTLSITDRLKDVIKSGGEWVSSLEVETILSFHPSVADVAVIGVPHERWGECPLALVVLKPEYTDTKADDILALGHQAVEKGHLPKYGVPSEIKFLAEMPRTSVGKLDKKRMRIMCAEKLI
ncbi:long-chain-fatty-acid--CoA ligase [Psychrobacter glaciei]|uniref:Long-chain-fatty-acid--CoA ligase n=1 Tax=Psychrobacter glaciei TaxID=619771 RepID=A0ABQ3GR57_9GAMM|nr:long-chain-fatty-acid--CoA ligase [Psychrobacter glaciei]GHD33406.1 long-chain-fatty-acid--CoA ligase [Psychrobacter glaciei]